MHVSPMDQLPNQEISPGLEAPGTLNATEKNGTARNSSTSASRSKAPSKGILIDDQVFYNQETLVIAGMQNSGKSSLLENLTGLPVPITTGIATRFPIKINLIEDLSKFQIKSSIISGYKDEPLLPSDIAKMHKIYDEPMTEASSVFGVPPPLFSRDQASTIRSVDPNSRQISKNILQLEMRGPNFKSLSFVDTPGLYASGSSMQDTKSAEEIDHLVKSLVSEGRTVIVGVMEVHQEPVNQKIFRFADDIDMTGERTIGVLTKVDCVPVGPDHTDQFQAEY
ncbi:hypothetical protein G7Y89_g8768 [Cudoniella acicularis]|uniref:Dynamin-type G domain-containing protein n=1 Tax=Cudoniella acicularis TaxID=354080 RepID=A0A8H4RIS9_9HELO|nr:hypothetical protein G7Y89_g8768 [Cudoniella acicularis]